MGYNESKIHSYNFQFFQIPEIKDQLKTATKDI